MPLRKSAIIEKAQNLVLKGLFRQAIKEWQRLLTETPNDGNIFNAMGDLHLKAGDKEEATASYVKSADAFRSAGFELKSIALFKKALKVDPLRVEINEKLASVYAERGLIGNAIDDYLKAAKHYLKQGDFRSSLSIYRKISNLDPDNENIRLKIAEMCEKEGFKEEAVEEYKKIMAIYAATNRTADLDKITKKILLLDPTYYRKDEPSLQEDFRADVVPDYEPVSQPLLTTSTFQEVSLSDQAVPDFLEPEPSPMAEEQTIYADQSLAGLDRKDEQSTTPLDKHEKSLESCLTEADVYLKYGLIEKTIRHLDLVLESFPSALEPHVKLKDIYIQQGEIEKALKECSILCRLYQEQDDQEKREAILNELMMFDSKKEEEEEEEEEEVLPDSKSASLPDPLQAEAFLESALPEEEPASCASVPETASISDSEARSHVEVERNLTDDSFLGEVSLPIGLNEEGSLKTEEADTTFSEIASSISSAEAFVLDEDSLDKRFEEREFSIDTTEIKSGLLEEEITASLPEENDALSTEAFSEASSQASEELLSSEEKSFSLDLDEPTLVASESYSSKSETRSSNEEFFEEAPLGSISDNKNGLSNNTQELSLSVHPGLESEGYVDLHAILSEDLGDSDNETALEKTIRYFQSEAEGENNAQEVETQYDLGIAYKEMGLLPEAVKAFEQASKGEVRFIDAVTMLVACHRELGSIDHAVDALREKLSDPYCQGKAGNILKYELAQLYDVQGNKKKAFSLYDEIFQSDPAFRDIESKMGTSVECKAPSPFSPSSEAVHSLEKERIKRRNRVSYL